MKINTKELKDFIQTWQDQGSEVADKVTYWNTLLEILGVPKQQIENKIKLESSQNAGFFCCLTQCFIDLYYRKCKE